MRRGRPKGRSNDQRSYGPLGDLIRNYRLQRGLGLADVAAACKCSVQFISNIEHGRAPLPWDKAEKLAQYLNIPLEELQAANMAIRSDFKTFISKTSITGRRVLKSQTGLTKLRDTAALFTAANSDSQLRELISLYHSAEPSVRKRIFDAVLKASE